MKAKKREKKARNKINRIRRIYKNRIEWRKASPSISMPQPQFPFKTSKVYRYNIPFGRQKKR